jgi:hypothetical protein
MSKVLFRITLFLLFCILEGASILLGHIRPDFTLSWYEFIMLGLAMSVMGPAIAYLTIGDFIRWPVVEVSDHSSGVGEDTNAKYQPGDGEPWYCGPLGAFGELIACPLCSSVWAGMFLLTFYALDGPIGRITFYVFAAGGLAWPLIRGRELLEWAKHLAWELTGHWNRVNKNEQYLDGVRLQLHKQAELRESLRSIEQS